MSQLSAERASATKQLFDLYLFSPGGFSKGGGEGDRGRGEG